MCDSRSGLGRSPVGAGHTDEPEPRCRSRAVSGERSHQNRRGPHQHHIFGHGRIRNLAAVSTNSISDVVWLSWSRVAPWYFAIRRSTSAEPEIDPAVGGAGSVQRQGDRLCIRHDETTKAPPPRRASLP